MKRILRHVGAKDFRKTHQRKLDEQRVLYLERREKEIQEEEQKKNIEEAAKPFKSDWRKEINLQESDWFPVDRGIANSTVQTFSLYSPDSGIERTFSGLGGVETHPSTVVVDGETLDAPTFSQLGLQGYAPPLGGVQRQTQQTENERIDAEIRKLEEQIKQVTKLQYEYADKHSSEDSIRKGIINAEWDAYHQALKDIYAETNASFELFEKEKSELGPGPGPNGEHQWNRPETESEQAARIAAGGYVGPGGTWTFGAGGTVTVGETSPQLSALLNKHQATLDKLSERTMALMASKDKMQARHDKENIAHQNAYDKKNNSFETQKDALRAKIVELEKQRPINQQLDASQQAYPNLPFMGARVQPAVGTSQEPTIGDTNFLTGLADKFGAGDAKRVFDYYTDVFLPNPKNYNKKVNMTKLINQEGMKFLSDMVNSVMNDSSLPMISHKVAKLNYLYVTNMANQQVPRGIRNILGMPDENKKGDGFVIDKNGNVKFQKAYDFDSVADFFGTDIVTGMPAGIYALSKRAQKYLYFPKKYQGASRSRKRLVRGGETPRMDIVVNIPIKGVKESTTWDRTKKHLKGA